MQKSNIKVWGQKINVEGIGGTDEVVVGMISSMCG
jgi:hypothetical protein